jgi:hypothetical protein
VKEGQLVSARDFSGRTRYDPAPIELMKARQAAGYKQAVRAPRPGGGAGKAQAAAFRMFAAGQPLREIVISTELAPAVVLDLRRQYASMGGDFLISAPGLEDLRDVLDWRGEATERGLLTAIRARVRRSFEQGQTAAADPPNHTTERDTSGNIDGGSAGEGGGSESTGEGALRVDPRGQAGQ